jgi:hypothetical protein
LEPPKLTFVDGVKIVELLMAVYQTAGEERTIVFPPPGWRRSCRRWGGGSG